MVRTVATTGRFANFPGYFPALERGMSDRAGWLRLDRVGIPLSFAVKTPSLCARLHDRSPDDHALAICPPDASRRNASAIPRAERSGGRPEIANIYS